MIIVALWAILILLGFVVIPYCAMWMYNRQLERCRPFTHRFRVEKIGGGRELWRCKHCDKVVAKG